jgi:hypothetical protein
MLIGHLQVLQGFGSETFLPECYDRMMNVNDLLSLVDESMPCTYD